MSEEELVILQNIQYALDNVGSVDFGDFEFDDIQGLLDLYQTKTEQLETAMNSLKKEKEKNKELEEYKKISELTKISCCTAQNCEALNNAIREGLENQKLREQLEQEKKANDIDLTIVYMNGFYDGEDKWRKKIKEKIRELENQEPADDDYAFEIQNDIHSKINVLQNILNKGEK